MKLRAVFDTNVAVVANGRRTHADAACQFRCIERLESIVASGTILIDDRQLILNEYRNRLTPTRGPATGDRFFLHVYRHQHVSDRVLRVPVTPRDDTPDHFEELPDDPRLDTFHRRDRKFAAVARVGQAPVWNATDSDWAEHEQALLENGIIVEQLCPEHATRDGPP